VKLSLESDQEACHYFRHIAVIGMNTIGQYEFTIDEQWTSQQTYKDRTIED